MHLRLEFDSGVGPTCSKIVVSVSLDEKYEELEKEATNLKKKLREEVTDEIYDFEMGKLKRHFARICAKGNLQKQHKLRGTLKKPSIFKDIIQIEVAPLPPTLFLTNSFLTQY